MNRIFGLGITSLLVFSFLSVQPVEAKWWKQRSNNRQCNQQSRINGGLGSGALTAREARRMQKQQRKLAKREARMRMTGGMSRKEARRLEKQQDQLSKNIYRQKHDGQTR